MNLSLYSAATGMEAQQLNLNAISNNIANVNTTGYKKHKMEFQDLLYQNPRAVGADAGNGNVTPTGVQLGNGSKIVSSSKVFTQGQLNQTGEKLDVAIEGQGFFEIERPDGTLAYTRDGALKVDANGRFVNSDGYPVRGGFQPLPNSYTDISISPTGAVTVYGPGGILQNYQLNLTRFPNPGGLRALGGNLYEETPGSGAPEIGAAGQGAFGHLRQSYLETSNVNVVEEMVNMIVAQRAYEINSKAIQTSDEMLSRLSSLKR